MQRYPVEPGITHPGACRWAPLLAYPVETGGFRDRRTADHGGEERSPDRHLDDPCRICGPRLSLRPATSWRGGGVFPARPAIAFTHPLAPSTRRETGGGNRYLSGWLKWTQDKDGLFSAAIDTEIVGAEDTSNKSLRSSGSRFSCCPQSD